MVLESPFHDVKLPRVPVANFALEKLKQFGDSVALIDPHTDQCWTFNELRDQSIQFALKLCSIGVQKGDVVGLVLENHPKSYPLVLAIGLCKAVVAACNIRATTGGIASELQLVKAKFCFCETSQLKHDLQEKLGEAKVFNFDDLADICTEKHKNLLLEILSTEGVDFDRTPMFISMTSGSTGKPKMVVRTNMSMMTCLFHNLSMGVSPGDCLVTVATKMHMFAIARFFSNVLTGVKHIITTKLNPDEFSTFLRKYSVHGVFVSDFVSTKRIIEESSVEGNSSFRFLIATGQIIPKELLRKGHERLKVVVTSFYGTTESGLIAGTATKQTPFESVGMLAPNVQLKIIDVQNGNELGANESGEIYVKSPNVFTGYLDNKSATDEVLDASGWLKTGDLGYFDSEGVVYLIDRIKNMIKSTGNSVVFPAQLETVLLSHPGVAEAVVVRTSHPIFNEAAKAFVVKQDQGLTEGELLAYYNAKVAEYQQLFGGLEFIDHIPKTGLGKPLRRALE